MVDAGGYGECFAGVGVSGAYVLPGDYSVAETGEPP